MKITIDSERYGRSFDVLFDKEDQDIVDAHEWHIEEKGGNFYAATHVKNERGHQRTVFMSKLIMARMLREEGEGTWH